MKKIFSALILTAMLFGLTACGAATDGPSSPADILQESGPAESSRPAEAPEEQPSEEAGGEPEEAPASEEPAEASGEGAEEAPAGNGDSRVLIAYFSATGNTENIANHIKTVLGDGADLYEITPETPYTEADLNYNDPASRSSVEMNDPDARPAISGNVADMGQYDVIFLGYPIWWGKAPRIIDTFLEACDLNGKTVVPFCTSASSGMGSSAAELQELAGSARWLEGRRFSGNTSAGDVADWVGALELSGADV